MFLKFLVGAHLVKAAAGGDVVHLVIEQHPVDKGMRSRDRYGFGAGGIAQQLGDIGADQGAVGGQLCRGEMPAGDASYSTNKGDQQIGQGIGWGAGIGAIGLVPAAGFDAELIAGHNLQGNTGADRVTGGAGQPDHIIIGVGRGVGGIAGRQSGTGIGQLAVIQIFRGTVSCLHGRGRIHVGLLLVGQHRPGIAQVIFEKIIEDKCRRWLSTCGILEHPHPTLFLSKELQGVGGCATGRKGMATLVLETADIGGDGLDIAGAVGGGLCQFVTRRIIDIADRALGAGRPFHSSTTIIPRNSAPGRYVLSGRAMTNWA